MKNIILIHAAPGEFIMLCLFVFKIPDFQNMKHSCDYVPTYGKVNLHKYVGVHLQYCKHTVLGRMS